MKYIALMLGFGLMASALGIGVLWYTQSHEPASAMGVIDAYVDYYELAQQERALISVPGHGDTQSRQRLSDILIQVLTEEVSNEQRLLLAQSGRDELIELRKRIDEATVVREQIERAVATFEQERLTLGGRELRAQALELHEAMLARQALVNDMTATLYAINGHTGDILEKIVQSDGVLSDEHVHSINQATGMAEARHDRLQHIYREFVASDAHLKSLAEAFVARAF